MKPNHYKLGKYEPFDIMAKTIGIGAFEVGNIIKYVLRYKNKNGVEDLLKARFYIKRLMVNKEKINILPIEINSEIDEIVKIAILNSGGIFYVIYDLIISVLKQDFILSIEAVNLLIELEEENENIRQKIENKNYKRNKDDSFVD